jgi:hypothetical protein
MTAGNFLLFALSDVVKMTKLQFDAAVAEVMPPDDTTNSALRRHHAQIALTNLGHCDAVTDEDKWSIAATPASLVRLPITGLPSAVLVGRRQPHTLEQLRSTANRFAGACVIEDLSTILEAPNRIGVVTYKERELYQIAESLGVQFLEEPAAWTIATFASSLDDYLPTLTWIDSRPLNWVRRRFDDRQVRMVPGDEVKSEETTLWSYEDPHSRKQRYELRAGTSGSWVDSDWGRWAVLAANDRNVLKYDAARHLLAAPAGAPFPVLLRRAACLCSGRLPSKLRIEATMHDVYQSVPQELAVLVAARLSQKVRTATIRLDMKQEKK